MSTTLLQSLDDPVQLWKHRVCMHEVSKNIEGQLDLLDRERQQCETDQGECTTLKTDHLLRARAASHDPCDTKVGQLLDGELVVRRLVSAFVDGNAERRGTHTGAFHWRGDGMIVEGRLSGTINAGTHREPVFDDCQRCHEPGVMEGVLRGRIVKSKDERLLGCVLVASYRIRFDPSRGFQDTGFTGTIEGLVICNCDGRRCVEFGNLAPTSQPNPWTHQGHVFEVFDHTGAATATADVVTWGAFTGLNANHRTVVDLAAAASSVDITLVHFATTPTVRALDGGGGVVDAATMTVAGTPETLTLTGPNIVRLEVRPPQDETLILRICSD